MKRALVTLTVGICVALYGYGGGQKSVCLLLAVMVLWLVRLHWRQWYHWGIAAVVLIGLGVQCYRLSHYQRLPEGGTLQGILTVNPNHYRVNGDTIIGEGEFTSGRKSRRITYTYRCKTEQDCQLWQDRQTVDRYQIRGTAETIEGARNKGTFDAKAYLASHGIWDKVQVKRVQAVKPSRSPMMWLQELRARVIYRVKLEPDSLTKTYALLLLFGDRREMDDALQEQYQRLGIMHLLAISGLHVTMLVHLVERLLWRVGVSRERTTLVVVGVLVVFGWMMDWYVSGTRAILMALLPIAGNRFGSRLSQVDSLCLVFIASVLWRPTIVLSVAFQLSYGLTAIVLLVDRWCHQMAWSVWPQRLAVPILVPLVALPVICRYFFVWNLWSVLVAYGLVFVFEWGILPGVMLYGVSLFVGGTFIVQSVLEWGLTLVHRVLDWFVGMPFGQLTFGQWQSWQWLIYWGILVVWAVLLEWKSIRPWMTSALLISVALLLFSIPYRFGTEVVMVDIGQGDAILIREPGWNNATLVDTGGEVSFAPKEGWRRHHYVSQAKRTLIPTLQAEGLSSLKAIMLSHADYDHVGNLEELLERIPTQTILIARGMESNERMQRIRHRYPTIQWKLTQAGEQIGHWSILAPNHSSKGGNDDSIIALYTIQGHRWLFTGDAPSQAEEAVVQRYPQLTVDFLKVGHHGSKTATSKALLSHTQPAVALISAGKQNRYHHPHPQTLERLTNYRIPTFTTKEDGAIRIQLRPHHYEVRTTLTHKTLIK